MKRISIITAAIAALAIPGIATAADTATQPQTQQPSNGAAGKGAVSNADKTFIEKAAQVNLTEIELGKAAEANSSDENVKRVARDLATQHTQAHQKLERLAASKGITLPDKLSPAQQKRIAALKEKKGEAFDKAYLKDNVQGQEQALVLFESAAQRSPDGEIKAWAVEMIPNLKRNISTTKSVKPEAVGERRNMNGSKQRKVQEGPTREQSPQTQQQQQRAPGAP